MVRTLGGFHSAWKNAVATNSVTRGVANQRLENYIKSNLDVICESLFAVEELEAKLASYEELIKELSGAKKAHIGTPENAMVQTAVVEPNDTVRVVDVTDSIDISDLNLTIPGGEGEVQ